MVNLLFLFIKLKNIDVKVLDYINFVEIYRELKSFISIVEPLPN